MDLTGFAVPLRHENRHGLHRPAVLLAGTVSPVYLPLTGVDLVCCVGGWAAEVPARALRGEGLLPALHSHRHTAIMRPMDGLARNAGTVYLACAWTHAHDGIHAHLSAPYTRTLECALATLLLPAAQQPLPALGVDVAAWARAAGAKLPGEAGA